MADKSCGEYFRLVLADIQSQADMAFGTRRSHWGRTDGSDGRFSDGAIGRGSGRSKVSCLRELLRMRDLICKVVGQRCFSR